MHRKILKMGWCNAVESHTTTCNTGISFIQVSVQVLTALLPVQVLTALFAKKKKNFMKMHL